MGYTLRAALDALPRTASVRVCELEPAVVAWCRGPLAELTGRALEDPRVEVVVADVRASLRAAASGALEPFDAIALDLFAGPRGTRDEEDHPLWGATALAEAGRALAPGGALGVWCEEPAPGFAKRLARVGLSAEMRRACRGGRRHAVYLARRALQVRGRNSRIGRRGGAFSPGHR
jgi:spermidine synthase